MRRSEFLQAGASIALLGAAPAIGKPEKPSLTIGMPVGGPSQLPMYVAITRTFAEQGLSVTLTEFRGDSEVSQALAGDSIDISLASLTGLINLLGAGQPVIGFYAGFNDADFSWLSLPAIKTWHDLKGKTIGVSTFGSLTDELTRYALRRNGLEPERDVQIIQAGGSPSALQAMRAGRLDAAIMGTPYRYQAQDAGFTVLGTQVKDVAPAWPKHLFMAKTKFIAANPNTMYALLRGHVAAYRLAKRDPSVAIKAMMDRLKYTEAYATRGYNEAILTIDERGHLPEKAMPVFWKLAVDNHDVPAPLPEAKFLDRRYIDSFNAWAPKD